jgi:hypothetical protein
MLLKHSVLEAIKAGHVSLVFRRWRRPTVKTGGALKTSVGVLSIDRVAEVERTEITERDAAAAGYDSLCDLLAELDSREGRLYRIEVHYAGADPRISLRQEDDLGGEELAMIRKRLDRLDSASQVGHWTRKVLWAIERHPNVAAAELAKRTAFEKDWLKINVRKLKDLGLTISRQPGYELSPRGIVVLHHLARTRSKRMPTK